MVRAAWSATQVAGWCLHVEFERWRVQCPGCGGVHVERLDWLGRVPHGIGAWPGSDTTSEPRSLRSDQTARPAARVSGRAGRFPQPKACQISPASTKYSTSFNEVCQRPLLNQYG
ncbi:hypothetical protein XhyaCFBP1156_06535 [Xanthomonas hyacinthi]|uniref:Transposase n=1 Tax=Xanthomonas hyacinthi TaxID=56455 RepID=A0A2S7EYY6_9XANT|nr:hypothetical protein XhyaCFBP1156_06535 [Xanthomonas hyacinthi]